MSTTKKKKPHPKFCVSCQGQKPPNQFQCPDCRKVSRQKYNKTRRTNRAEKKIRDKEQNKPECYLCESLDLPLMLIADNKFACLKCMNVKDNKEVSSEDIPF